MSSTGPRKSLAMSIIAMSVISFADSDKAGAAESGTVSYAPATNPVKTRLDTDANNPSQLGEVRTIRLCNKWSRSSVQVELRIGNMYNCEENSSAGTRDIPYESCSEVQTAQDVCYRRVGSDTWNRAPLGNWEVNV